MIIAIAIAINVFYKAWALVLSSAKSESLFSSRALDLFRRILIKHAHMHGFEVIGGGHYGRLK